MHTDRRAAYCDEENLQENHVRWVVGASAMVICSLAACGMLICSKWVMIHAHVPSFVSSIQFFAVFVVVQTLALVAPGARGCPSEDDVQLRWNRLKPYLQHSLLFVTSIYSNLRALQHSSVQTIIVFRSACPLLVCWLDWAFLGRHLPSQRSLLALVVIAGSACGYVLCDHTFRMQGFGAYTWCLAYLVLISFESAFGKWVTGAVKFPTVWGQSCITTLRPCR